MSKTYKLKLASAVVVNGQPVAAGNIVDVDEAKARRLLDAGKADLATAEDVAPDDEAQTEAPAPTEPPAPAQTEAPAPAKGGKAKGEAK